MKYARNKLFVQKIKHHSFTIKPAIPKARGYHTEFSHYITQQTQHRKFQKQRWSKKKLLVKLNSNSEKTSAQQDDSIGKAMERVDKQIIMAKRITAKRILLT